MVYFAYHIVNHWYKLYISQWLGEAVAFVCC